jgi:2-amino-4-hydroxy-6-hydroxymethyldihydropteridine diphosphokinase
LAAKIVYLSLGSNLGDRQLHLDTALEKLEQQHFHVVARSSIYETEPQDVTEQPWFLNTVVACETRYFPLQLLKILQGIEREMGRTRRPNAVRRGPRPIDLDILLYGKMVVNTPQLTIPHARLLHRRFVLEPLLEIAPDLKLPGSMQPLKSYLREVALQRVRKLD